jgi:hypothetical protein
MLFARGFYSPFRKGMCRISCIATADALKALSGFATELTSEDRLGVFNKHRKLFQRVATAKYDAAEVNEAGPLVIVSAADVAKW